MTSSRLGLWVVCAVLSGCTSQGDTTARPPASSEVAATAPTVSSAPVADPELGGSLVDKYECHRCHEGTALAPMPREKSCVRCHQDILAGRFEAPPDALKTWRKNIVHLRHVPSLDRVGALLREDWLADFLRAPHDLRPNLPATMPRLDISEEHARHIAAYLVRDAPPAPEPASSGDAERGKMLFAKHACGKCHAFSLAERLGPPTLTGEPRGLDPAVLLAPDLRHTRARVRPGALVKWLLDPQGMRPGARMPKAPLSPVDAADLAAYLVETPLADPPHSMVTVRLPVLERRVGYEEVSANVFKKICWHCHSQPDFARGDGGPGMTGGFGFAGRKLDLSSYEAIAGGYLDSEGQMVSAFRKAPDGLPMIVSVMRARRSEELGTPVDGVRGMPMGLPAMTPEDIQLVESWVSQGRPQ